MKIIFGTSFDSNPYISEYRCNSILWDTTIVGEQGLLELLELHAGCRRASISRLERVVLYQKSISEYLSDKKDCFLKKSFITDPLGTAGKVLEWRDRLILCGWSSEMRTSSKRLQALCDLEEKFLPDGAGFPDNWMNMLKTVGERRILPENSTIEVHHSKEFLSPYLQEMFEELDKKGAKCEYITPNPQATANSNLYKVQDAISKNIKEKIELDPTDDSLLLYHFKERMDALEYISCKGSKDAVYINSDNKAFDYVQRLFNFPVSGSRLADSTPEIVQLFRLGLSLYNEDFSLENILSWLSIPIHPLKSELRYKLKKIILDSGGICNEEWNKNIEEYDKQDDIAVFLPLSKNGTPETKKVTLFITRLQNFALQRLAMQKIEKQNNTLVSDQLVKLIELTTAIGQLLKSINKDKLESGQLGRLIASIDSNGSYQLDKPEKGCRYVCSQPDALVDTIEDCIWLDFYNAQSISNYYGFLLQGEYKELMDAGAKLWSSEAESLLHIEKQLTPLMLSKKLTLMFCEKSSGESTTQHPLKLRMEKLINNYVSIVKSPCLGKTKEVDVFDNIVPVAELKLDNAAELNPRQQESATSLEKLIYNPLDYVLNYHAGLRKNSTLPSLSISMGNSAHEYIALLVKNSNFEIAEMKRQFIENFNIEMEGCILRNAALLNQKENELNKKSYLSKIEKSVNNLLEIIEENDLKIISAEGAKLEDNADNVSKPVRLLGDKEIPVINSRMDMVLTNTSGYSVIIDFKWTKHIKYHREAIKNNLSIQLAIYEELEKHNNPNGVAAKCYFELDEGILLTQKGSGLKGKNIDEVETDVSKDLMEQIRNSYKFRYNQFANGIIEWGEDFLLTDLAYVRETYTEKLFPINKNNSLSEKKAINKISDFTSLTSSAK